MARTLSNAAMQAAMAQSSDEVWVELLDIEHPDLPETIYVANDTADVVSGGNTYLDYPFKFDNALDDGEREPVAQLLIANVDRALVDDIRTVRSPISFIYKLVLASTPDTIEQGPIRFEGRAVNYDAASIQFELGFQAFTGEPLGWMKFTPEYFPGMFVRV